MGLFSKRRGEDNPLAAFPRDQFEPVVRRSICTGERVFCVRERETGRVHEIELVRTSEELAAFCRRCGVDVQSVPTIY